MLSSLVELALDSLGNNLTNGLVKIDWVKLRCRRQQFVFPKDYVSRNSESIKNRIPAVIPFVLNAISKKIA